MAPAPRRSSRPNGELKLDIPHDRQATFERQLAGKYQCRLPGFDDHVISMYARGMSVRMIQGHLLRLSFADVDFLNPNLSKRPRDKLARTVTAEQAQAIHSFVEALPIENVSMVIDCEGGHSRSCAVALARHPLYGYQADRASFARHPCNRPHHDRK